MNHQAGTNVLQVVNFNILSKTVGTHNLDIVTPSDVKETDYARLKLLRKERALNDRAKLQIFDSLN